MLAGSGKNLSISLSMAAALLLAAQAAAETPRPVSHYKEVPNPIPADFNQCVRVFATEKGYSNGFDRSKKWARWNPPLTRTDHALLEWYRREGWGKLVVCRDHGA